MAKLRAISRRKLVEHLRTLGFEGPFFRGKHPYMIRGKVRLTIPNPHEKNIGVDLLARLLRQAGISRDEWTALP